MITTFAEFRAANPEIDAMVVILDFCCFAQLVLLFLPVDYAVRHSRMFRLLGQRPSMARRPSPFDIRTPMLEDRPSQPILEKGRQR